MENPNDFDGWASASDENDELWNGPYDTREDAIKEGREIHWDQPFYVARCRPVKASDEPPEGEDWTFIVPHENNPRELIPATP